MPFFTIALKEAFKLTGGTVVITEGISVLTGGNIGLNDYPLYDDTYRPALNGRIYDHYQNQEIGMETIDMFQLAMRRKMNEIMPYYNKLYLSNAIEFSPLSTVDLHTENTVHDEQTGTTDANSDSTSDATGSSRSVSSDTPQTMLAGNADYASSAADANSVSNNVTNASQTNNESKTDDLTGTTDITGYQGAASDLLMRYRESIINIDIMIINELEELFMLVWDNGDSYTKGYLL